MRHANHTKTRAYIRHLCSLGFPSESIMPSILRATREIVGADFAHFIWADEHFEIAKVYSECPAAYATLPAYERLRRGEVARLIGDFSDWMTLSRDFRNSSTVDQALSRSQFYDEVLAPCHARHFIHVVARQGKRGWGSMILVRESRGRQFSDTEHHAVDALGEHIGHAIRCPLQTQGPFSDSSQSGILIVDWNGRILHQSDSTRRLLLESTDSTREHGCSKPILAPALRDLVMRLKYTSSRENSRPAVTEISNRWGRFVWRAYPLDSDSGCALHCQHQEPVMLQMLTGAHIAGLSDRQQLIASRLACGATYRQVAAEIRTKESTVTDSVREIYLKLDVHGIDALNERLRIVYRTAQIHM